MASRDVSGIFALLFAGFALLSACDASTIVDTEENLHVHFQGGFSQTPVQVVLNGRTVYNETVSTNYALGLAGGESFLMQPGMNVVEIRAAHDLLWKNLLILRSPVYLGVNIQESENEIQVVRRAEPFLYY